MKPKTVMIVDDDPDILEIINLVMSHAGYEVVEVGSGQACLELARRQPPDIILLDIMMPEPDGWRVFESLRETPATASIPVIALTAKSQSVDKMIGLHVMKFDDYITKPFGRRELLGAVERLLGK